MKLGGGPCSPLKVKLLAWDLGTAQRRIVAEKPFQPFRWKQQCFGVGRCLYDSFGNMCVCDSFEFTERFHVHTYTHTHTPQTQSRTHTHTPTRIDMISL